MSALLRYDTLDDRREAWHLLHRLPPRDRVAFLRWACTLATGKHGRRPDPVISRESVRQAYRCDRADERLTNECYADYLALVAQWDLDQAAALAELVRWVRTGRSAPAPSSPCPSRPSASA